MTPTSQEFLDYEQLEPLCKAVNKLLKPTESLVLVGMMGAGKTTIGRKIATLLDRPFVDTDLEIENASQMTVSEIFEKYGEDHFRDLERRLILRTLHEQHGIIAVGGGAFMDKSLREAIGQTGISIWLKTDLQTLVGRVHRKGHRPLLKNGNTEEILQDLMEKRKHIYGLSDIIVNNSRSLHENIEGEILEHVLQYLRRRRP